MPFFYVEVWLHLCSAPKLEYRLFSAVSGYFIYSQLFIAGGGRTDGEGRREGGGEGERERRPHMSYEGIFLKGTFGCVLGALGGAVGSCGALQFGRPRIRFLMGF